METLLSQQALHAATEAKIKLKSLGIPFERPADYFAEMVKTDAHMAKVRQSLLDESNAIKASQDAKKQRELKKVSFKVE